MKAVLSVAYFPPVQFFTKFFKYEILIEKHEYFVKQTFRNRTQILTSTGVQSLTVPVKRKYKIKITDILIDNSVNWQRHHLRALQTAYGSSPFFDFLIDDLMPVFTHKYKFLWDLDLATIEIVDKILNLNLKYGFTDFFIPLAEEDNPTEYKDFRYIIRPKRPGDDNEFLPYPYTQVFSDKFAFVPNLSILDLMFNIGLEAKEYLKRAIR